MSEKKFWNEKIETLPREKLEALQLKALKEELAFAYANSPYYRRAWQEAGVSPDDVKTLSDIAKLPFVDKKTQRDTQGVGSFLGELAAVPEEEVVFVSTSSGSTGVPTMSPFTKRDFDEWQDVESRLFWGAGMRENDRYVHALNFS
ncbi:MAG: phenylacetate--CoA ligase family protein, partial [Oscillospiraceae bacterium]|nr:phenylacetate--CoA ligase family protein [Oscillospiraceae bacterium]